MQTKDAGPQRITIHREATMPSTGDEWDKMPVADRVEVAKSAGVTGKAGSSSWVQLHPDDQKQIAIALTGHIAPEAEGASLASSGTEVDYPEPTDEELEGLEKAQIAQNIADCLPSEDRAKDYILWVGYGSYPTIKAFMEEAKSLGVSRRISRVPSNLVLDESKIFLAHDEGEIGDAVIFAYFVPEKIEVIVYDADTVNGIPDYLEGVADMIPREQAQQEPERGCGYREDVGAIYLVSGEITEISPYKDYNRLVNADAKRFRGIKKVDGNRILKGKVKKAPSITHAIPKSDRIKREKGSAWTQEEEDRLRELLKTMRPWRALREMHKITGRSIHGIAYQYEKMKKADRLISGGFEQDGE